VTSDDEDFNAETDAEGRADHQAPEVDGTTVLPGIAIAPGTIVSARVVSAVGADLIAEPLDIASAPRDGHSMSAPRDASPLSIGSP
jgi:TRAM domain